MFQRAFCKQMIITESRTWNDELDEYSPAPTLLSEATRSSYSVATASSDSTCARAAGGEDACRWMMAVCECRDKSRDCLKSLPS